jgi:hypothetical protein
VIASYLLKKEILKTDVLLREAQKDAFGLSSSGTNIFQCKRQKLTSSTITTTMMEQPRASNTTDEKVYFEITEFPDDVKILEEVTEKNGETEETHEINDEYLADPNMKIKTEPTIEHPKIKKISSNNCKKCSFVAEHHLGLLHHIDSSTENCINWYEPTKECSICHKKFMLETTKKNHILNVHT